MVQKDENYVYGAVAKKLEYDVYEENKILKSKKQIRSNSKAKTKLVINIMIIFSLCLILMYRYALITELNYNISKSDKKYNEIRKENSQIKVDIENNTDLTKIKEIAENRLAMQKPDRSQVVYLRVPKSDFTVVADTDREENKAGNSMLAVLMDKVGKFAQLLY